MASVSHALVIFHQGFGFGHHLADWFTEVLVSVIMIIFDHTYRGSMAKPAARCIISSKPLLLHFITLPSHPFHSFQNLMDSLNCDITLADIALMQHLFGCLQSLLPIMLCLHHLPLLCLPLLHLSFTNQTVQQSNQALLATQSLANRSITVPYLSSTISQALPASNVIHHVTSAHLSHPAPSGPYHQVNPF